MTSPIARIRLGLLIPLAATAFAAVIIASIGIVLLIAADMRKETLLGMKEPLAVIGSLVIASAVLAGAALMTKRGPSR